MKIVILAGGKGLRLTEETINIPKPLVEIGGLPVICHIMRYYSHFNFNDFVIALGYKGALIKKFFLDYYYLHSDLQINFGNQNIVATPKSHLPWKMELVETGLETMTGGRIKRLQRFIGNETFMLTWCDTLANVDLDELLKFHRSHGKWATLTAVTPPARFGHLEIEGNQVKVFSEKKHLQKDWINGAFFVLEPQVFDYIKDDNTSWENDSLATLAREGQLMAYFHEGFWQCMDTIHEKNILCDLWAQGEAPWNLG